MARDAVPPVPYGPRLSVLLRAWIATAVVDGLFSSVLSAVFYQSTVARLWQGVASTLLGSTAMAGGARTVLIGLAMHLTTAFWWSSVFLFLVMRLRAVRAMLATWPGALAVAVVYGPCIWMAMSLVVIPTLTHRPPTVAFRWWVQFFGHMSFVALPMITAVKLSAARSAEPASRY